MLRTLLSLFALDAAILCARYGLTIRRIRSGTHFFAVWFALAKMRPMAPDCPSINR